MNLKSRFCICLVAGVVMMGCRSTRGPEATSDAWKVSLAEIAPADAVSTTAVSPDSTWVLAVLKQGDPVLQPMVSVRLLILDRVSGALSADLTPGPGVAEWHDGSHVRFTPTPGMVQQDAGPPTYYLIEAATGKRKPAGDQP